MPVRGSFTMSWWTTLQANEAQSAASGEEPREKTRRGWTSPARIGLLLVFCVLAVSAVSSRRSTALSKGRIREGVRLPRLELRDTRGNDVSIRGRSLLLFFRSGCLHCERALSALGSRADSYREAHVGVLAVCLESQEQARVFVRSRNLPFPVVVGSMKEFASVLGEKAVPVVYLVDSTLGLRYRRAGGFGALEAERLGKLLSEGADAAGSGSM